ncbi:MAG: dihydrodipicolinate synthase family protein [Bryobacteraceae bacterium]
MTRREALALFAAAAPSKSLEGIFPILQTPFTDSGGLDSDVLAREVKFCARCGVAGVVWPQLASEWSELTPDERRAGAEVVVAAAKGTAPAVVLGVQAADAETAAGYAGHAQKLGADAIIALPPPGVTALDRVADYYHAIARASALPLFVQTIGEMSVEFVRRLAAQNPTLRYVKDEAGHTLTRLSEYRRSAPDLAVFTGAHGRTLIDEIARGSAGSMPAAAFADLYVDVWRIARAGRREEALERFAPASVLIHQVQTYGLASVKYILHLRGVFPNWRCRGARAGSTFDAEAERAVRASWEFARKRMKG